MTKVFIFDETGKELSTDNNVILLRRDKLLKLFSNLDITAEIWNTQKLGSDYLILAHLTDLSNLQYKQLCESGATVFFYTAGDIVEQNDVTTSTGCLYYLRWENLLKLLEKLPKDFNLNTVDIAFKAHQKDYLVNSLVILSSYITLSSDNISILDRQKEWKTNKTKWLEIFQGYEQNDFIIAFGLGVNNFIELSEVRSLLDWLWSSDINKAPDFSKIHKQLVEYFKLSI
ncbi:MAG: hypothetical protein NTY50_01125 [Methylobacter sp.]|nr:hypothetical protein [Methylobacter sp.]